MPPTEVKPAPAPAGKPNWTRNFAIVAIVLLVPVVPFLFLGDALVDPVGAWVRRPDSVVWTFAAVSAALATDIVLPIPSSMVSTAAGAPPLGFWLGTAASWLGMTVGAVAGFALAYFWGRPVARRFCSDDDLARMHRLSERVGPLLIVLCRPLPVVAEASVLLFGIHRLAWRRFLPTIILANLVVAAVYAGLGEAAAGQQWLPLAVGISGALPILFVLTLRAYIAGRSGAG